MSLPAGVAPAATPFAPPVPRASGAAPVARPCANCGHAADENFCPQCGQETHDLHRSLGGILAEVLDAFTGWDSKIPMSIGLLVARPGALTVEFLAGRRVRYLRPLRLYLTMSVLFFLSVGLVHNPRVTTSRGMTLGGVMRIQDDGAPPRAAVPADDSVMRAFVGRHAGESGPGAEAWLKHRIKEGMRSVMQLPPAQRAAALQGAFFSRIGNVVFVLMPIFAALLRLLYRRGRLFFAEHFVFALHVHAFAMCALMFAHVLSASLPGPYATVAAVAQLAIPVYLFLAMRRVYGESRRRTALKFLTLSATYGTVVVIATSLTALYAIMQLAG